MKKAIRKLLTPKKVTLHDVASPQPSRAASRVLKGALKRAYADQQTISREAAALRSN